MHDVAIAGFGPCGATLAALLGQAGVRVLVVGRERAVYEKPRAFALDHEIMRVFQNAGIAAAVSAHTASFMPSEFYGAGGRIPLQVVRMAEMAERDGVVAAWFARQRCGAVLPRPDHYVYGVADDAEGAGRMLRELEARLTETEAVA